MTMSALFAELADIFVADVAFERHARAALKSAAHQQMSGQTSWDSATIGHPASLPDALVSVMTAPDAHPVCRHLLQLQLDWSPPTTSNDPLFINHNQHTVHIELLGPRGLVYADHVRIGLYGMISDAACRIRTHPAEEIYIMLAGSVWWKRGDDHFRQHNPGSRSHHPSMMPHANRTEERAFMSIYAWQGDISTDDYVYDGLPS